jgi:hypothetical protein
MINIAIGLFLTAALVGLYMASRIFRGSLPPVAAAILHGLLAASGLLILLYAVVTGAQEMVLLVAAGLLVIAALGGFVMVTFHMRTQAPPKALVVIHALAAVVGVAALLGNTLGMV